MCNFVQCAPVANLGRIVPGHALAPTMVHATPSTARASVTQDGLAVTAHSVSTTYCRNRLSLEKGNPNFQKYGERLL